MSAGSPSGHSDGNFGSRGAVIGVDGNRYECHHGWGQLPAQIHWHETHGVAIDAAGLIYITHRAPADVDTVVVFDPTGKFVRSFGKEYAGTGHGIDIRSEGGEQFLYLTFTRPQRKIVKTTLTGERIWEFQQPVESGKYADVTDFNPTNMAFAPDGGFYAADGYGSHFIHQYDRAARWVRSWGGAGTEIGRFQTPHGIWLDDRPGHAPALVVADRANARLQYFTLDGQPIPERLVTDVSFPADFDTRGTKLLVADLHARVSILDGNNHVIVHLGHDPEWTKQVLHEFQMRTRPDQWQDGRFIHPHDACWDRRGNIFVVEWVIPGRVTFLKRID